VRGLSIGFSSIEAEPITNGMIDLGRIATDALFLAIDWVTAGFAFLLERRERWRCDVRCAADHKGVRKPGRGELRRRHRPAVSHLVYQLKRVHGPSARFSELGQGGPVFVGAGERRSRNPIREE